MKPNSSRSVLAGLILVVCLMDAISQAGFMDFFKSPGDSNTPGKVPSAPTLTETDIAGGLKEALIQGVNHAVAELGKTGGFLNNIAVKIPVPAHLQNVELAARAAGYSRQADEFVATMNHAAEQAVPAAVQVFARAIANLTVTDAQFILAGPEDAATQYFRQNCELQLHDQFLPIVKEATAKTGVTAAYKTMLGEAGPVAGLLGRDAGDLDDYVTKHAMNGLFKMVASEEAKIRASPVARTSDLMKKVFASAK